MLRPRYDLQRGFFYAIGEGPPPVAFDRKRTYDEDPEVELTPTVRVDSALCL